jgi:lysozyme
MIQNSPVVDLSHWNTVTDWHAIKRSGVIGVIHKFSQGTGYRDPMFDEARAGCKAAGLLFGRYHFAEGSDTMSQVRNFLADYEDGELLALDWEDNTSSTGTMSLSQAVQFVTEVEGLTGQWPALYSGHVLKEALGAPNATLSKCRLWLAQYADQPVCPPGWDKPWLWQWTDEGKNPGVTGNVDLDAFEGSEATLRAEWCGLDRPPLLVPERPARPERHPRPPTDHGDVIPSEYDYISLIVPGSVEGGMLTLRVPAGVGLLIHTTGDRRDIVVSG